MNRSAALLAVTLAAAVAAQPPSKGKLTTPGGIPPAAMAYNGIGIVRLLENQAVRDELKPTKEVMQSLPLLREEMSESTLKFAVNLQETTQDRDAFLRLLVAHSRQTDKHVEEMLGESFVRFKQIRRRVFGISAAMTADAEVREAILMTEDQRTRINAGLKEPRKWLEDVLRSAGKRRLPPGAIDKAYAEYSVREEKLYMEVLDEAQQSKWKQLIGAAFEVPVELLRMVRRNDYDGSRKDGMSGEGRQKRKTMEKPSEKTEPEKKPPTG